MQFDKTQVLELLKSRGQHDTAAQAEGELPQTVDTDNQRSWVAYEPLGVVLAVMPWNRSAAGVA